MGPKKQVYTPFVTRTRCRSVSGPAGLGPDESQQPESEFREVALNYGPPIGKMEAGPIEVSFRCTCKLIRGDTITLRLAGFKGQTPTLFTVDPKPGLTDNKLDGSFFHGYWGGETAIKGGPPPNAITLQVRREIEANTLVSIVVPESVHIILPEKLPASSQKLKIEGAVKHATSGKIPKAPITSFIELKKKKILDIEQDFQDMLARVKELEMIAGGEECEELQHARDILLPEAEQMWEEVRNVSDLRWGIQWRFETSICHSIDDLLPIMKSIPQNYLDVAKKKTPLAFQRELAQNLGCKVSLIILLEDILYSLYGHFYQAEVSSSANLSLKRSAILALRLWTCESHDICRILSLTAAPCIRREIHSAVRTQNQDELLKWAHFLGVMMTTCNTLGDLNLVPPLYRAVKELPQQEFDHIKALKKDQIFMFANFTEWSTEPPVLESADSDVIVSLPENAVLFECEGAMDGVELVEISQYPGDREFLLPLFTMFLVEEVDASPDRNLIVVKLKVRGALVGRMFDTSFTQEHEQLRMVAKGAVTRAKTNCSNEQSHHLAKLIYANLKLNQVKERHPEHCVHILYLEKYADAARSSWAKQVVDNGTIRWMCANPPEAEGSLDKANWEKLAPKTMYSLEETFLKRTRTMKQFQVQGIGNFDFQTMTGTELAGVKDKGLKHLKRVLVLTVGKERPYFTTHPFAPL